VKESVEGGRVDDTVIVAEVVGRNDARMRGIEDVVAGERVFPFRPIV